MLPRKPVAMFTVLACTSLLACAGVTGAQDLPARSVKFSANKLPLNDVLKQLQEQTGNTLKDRRTTPLNPIFAVKPGTFWPTLDDLCDQAGIGYSPHGGITLIDTPNSKRTIAYSGVFRFAVKRITVFSDDEAQAHRCQIALDVAWEPYFQAVYLNLEQGEVEYTAKKRVKLESRDKYNVVGKTAERVEFPLAAPERITQKLASLSGTMRVIGAPKMLEFTFPAVKPDASAVQEGVAVKVPAVKAEIVNKKLTRLSIEVDIAFPAGAIINVESFQEPALGDLNRVWLSWTDAKNKTHELDWTGRGAPKKSKTGLTYHFEPRGGTLLPPVGADVTLRVRAPQRVSAFTVPFEFRDLPLP